MKKRAALHGAPSEQSAAIRRLLSRPPSERAVTFDSVVRMLTMPVLVVSVVGLLGTGLVFVDGGAKGGGWA